MDERAKRTGAYIELLGTYNPLTEPKDIKLKQDRIDYWVKQGAQLSTGYLRIIGKAPQRPPRKPKKEKKTEEPVKTEETPSEESAKSEEAPTEGSEGSLPLNAASSRVRRQADRTRGDEPQGAVPPQRDVVSEQESGAADQSQKSDESTTTEESEKKDEGSA